MPQAVCPEGRVTYHSGQLPVLCVIRAGGDEDIPLGSEAITPITPAHPGTRCAGPLPTCDYGAREGHNPSVPRKQIPVTPLVARTWMGCYSPRMASWLSCLGIPFCRIRDLTGDFHS